MFQMAISDITASAVSRAQFLVAAGVLVREMNETSALYKPVLTDSPLIGNESEIEDKSVNLEVGTSVFPCSRLVAN